MAATPPFTLCPRHFVRSLRRLIAGRAHCGRIVSFRCFDCFLLYGGLPHPERRKGGRGGGVRNAEMPCVGKRLSFSLVRSHLDDIHLCDRTSSFRMGEVLVDNGARFEGVSLPSVLNDLSRRSRPCQVYALAERVSRVGTVDILFFFFSDTRLCLSHIFVTTNGSDCLILFGW